MKKKILIAGFGDTGVLAAINLSKNYQITAVSTKPMLVSGQELGVRITRPEDWECDYLIPYKRYKRLQGVKVLHGEITSIAPQKNSADIFLSSGETIKESYDVLLVASGVRNGFWRNALLEDEGDIRTALSQRALQFSKAHRIAVVGGGATGVSSAYNLKKKYPKKDIHLFFSGEKFLPQYPSRARKTIAEMLNSENVVLHSGYRAKLSNDKQDSLTENTTIQWQGGQADFSADLVLWAVGRLIPNSQYLPSAMLNDRGFVKADQYLRVPGYSNVFTVGDIAASDPNRSSARNAGFITVAHNIDCYLNEHEEKMRRFKAVKYRWGSILGVQLDEGLRVFTPKGGSMRVSFWWVKNLLFPFFVKKIIYKGLFKPS